MDVYRSFIYKRQNLEAESKWINLYPDNRILITRNDLSSHVRHVDYDLKRNQSAKTMYHMAKMPLWRE
jgi:hypothetical protein